MYPTYLCMQVTSGILLCTSAGGDGYCCVTMPVLGSNRSTLHYSPNFNMLHLPLEDGCSYRMLHRAALHCTAIAGPASGGPSGP